ncbi:MAG: CBS domain-containing protein [Nocardioides sp.]
MLVYEVMTTRPATVSPQATIKAALGLLAEHRVTALPVVSDTREVVGVVSEADLIRELLARDPRAHEIARQDSGSRSSIVEQVMSTHPVTVRPDADLVQAVDLLTSTVVKSLPVVDRAGRLAGVLSRSDVIRLLARADHDIECEVDELLRSTGLDGWLVEVEDGFVQLLGPERSNDSLLARLLAETVPGVIEVSTRTEGR